MDCPFQVGDEVICVRGGTALIDGRTYSLVEGGTYTIAEIAMPGQKTAMGTIGVDEPMVQLAELGHCEWPWAWGVRSSRFRKVERKTDKQSLTEWLSQPAGDTDRIDRSAPIAPRKRERAS